MSEYPIPTDLHEEIKRWLWKKSFFSSRNLDVADVAAWIEEFVSERIARLEAQNKALCEALEVAYKALTVAQGGEAFDRDVETVYAAIEQAKEQPNGK